MFSLVKEALSPAVMAGMARSIKGLGSGAGMGGALGGVIGGTTGAVRGFQEQRDSGAEIGRSIVGGLKGSVPGAVKGGLLGAAAGGAAGALRPAYAESVAPHLRGASNFGQRQVHALTGVGDTGYLRSIGGGAADAQQRFERAINARHAAKPGTSTNQLSSEYTKARRGLEASEKSEAMGLHSIPGYAKALVRNPKEALKTGIQDQWRNLGTGGRALMYGAPAVGIGSELAKGDEDGAGRLERTGRLAGAAASGVLAPLAIGGDLAAGGVLSGGLGRAGRWADQFKRRHSPSRVAAAPAPDPAGGDSQAEAHVISDRAAGVVPEGING